MAALDRRPRSLACKARHATCLCPPGYVLAQLALRPHARALSAASSVAYANTWPAPQQFHGSTTRQSALERSAIVASVRGSQSSLWLAPTTTTSALSTACSSDAVG